MNKDEKLLEKVYDGDMTILSAMEQQAVDFAEWLQQHCIYTDNGFYYYAFTNRQYNLTDLYQLFNQVWV